MSQSHEYIWLKYSLYHYKLSVYHLGVDYVSINEYIWLQYSVYHYKLFEYRWWVTMSQFDEYTYMIKVFCIPFLALRIPPGCQLCLSLYQYSICQYSVYPNKLFVYRLGGEEYIWIQYSAYHYKLFEYRWWVTMSQFYEYKL